MTWTKFYNEYILGSKTEITESDNGEWLRVIDNDGDGIVDYVLRTDFVMTTVTDYEKRTDVYDVEWTGDLPNGNGKGTIAASAIRGVDGIEPDMSVGSVILYTLIDGYYYISNPAPITQSIDNKSINSKAGTFTADGTEYTWSGIDRAASKYYDNVSQLAYETKYDMYPDYFDFIRLATETSRNFVLLTDGYYATDNRTKLYKADLYDGETLISDVEVVDAARKDNYALGSENDDGTWTLENVEDLATDYNGLRRSYVAYELTGTVKAKTTDLWGITSWKGNSVDGKQAIQVNGSTLYYYVKNPGAEADKLVVESWVGYQNAPSDYTAAHAYAVTHAVTGVSYVIADVVVLEAGASADNGKNPQLITTARTRKTEMALGFDGEGYGEHSTDFELFYSYPQLRSIVTGDSAGLAGPQLNFYDASYKNKTTGEYLPITKDFADYGIYAGYMVVAPETKDDDYVQMTYDGSLTPSSTRFSFKPADLEGSIFEINQLRDGGYDGRYTENVEAIANENLKNGDKVIIVCEGTTVKMVINVSRSGIDGDITKSIYKLDQLWTAIYNEEVNPDKTPTIKFYGVEDGQNDEDGEDLSGTEKTIKVNYAAANSFNGKKVIDVSDYYKVWSDDQPTSVSKNGKTYSVIVQETSDSEPVTYTLIQAAANDTPYLNITADGTGTTWTAAGQNEWITVEDDGTTTLEKSNLKISEFIKRVYPVDGATVVWTFRDDAGKISESEYASRLMSSINGFTVVATSEDEDVKRTYTYANEEAAQVGRMLTVDPMYLTVEVWYSETNVKNEHYDTTASEFSEDAQKVMYYFMDGDTACLKAAAKGTFYVDGKAVRTTYENGYSVSADIEMTKDVVAYFVSGASNVAVNPKSDADISILVDENEGLKEQSGAYSLRGCRTWFGCEL